MIPSPSESDSLLDRLPHRGPMRFLTNIREIEASSIQTETVLTRDFILMSPAGEVSALAAIELFAQSAAALMAYRTSKTAMPQVSGALLGTRKLRCLVSKFAEGDVLIAEAREVFGAGPLAQFDCTLTRRGELVAEGSINVVSGSNVVRG